MILRQTPFDGMKYLAQKSLIVHVGFHEFKVESKGNPNLFLAAQCLKSFLLYNAFRAAEMAFPDIFKRHMLTLTI